MILEQIFILRFNRNNSFKIIQYSICLLLYLLCIFLAIFIILYISKIKYFFFNINTHTLTNNNKIDKKRQLNRSIYSASNNAKSFIFKTYEGILINKIPFLSNFTKISCIIPIYNCEKTIKRAVRSVQNQNMIEIEIVLVNDYSLDNTINIINELSRNDSRIKIINNKKNMGTLYTRCIGSLLAKGKYIVPLDSDDMILNYDVFNTLYKEMNKNYYDIILFKTIIVNNITDFFNNKNLIEHRSHNKIIILNQPELGKYGAYSGVIWGKSIRAKIYKKAIKAYGAKRYSFYIIFGEDAIINYIIHQFSKTSIFLLTFGILHIYRDNSVIKITNRKQRNIFALKFIEVIFEFSPNTIKEKELVKLLETKSFYSLLLEEKYRKLFNILIIRILNSKYISYKNKNLIIKNFLFKYNSFNKQFKNSSYHLFINNTFF